MALICLDPGHGGEPGASSKPWWQSWIPGVEAIREADATLGIAVETASRLTSLGHEVRLTRWADIDVSLDDRIAMFNSRDWDAVVSIHANASGTSGTSRADLGRGHETWWDAGDDSSREFAQVVNDRIDADWGASGLTNRGIKMGSPATRASWYAFQGPDQPADILIEMAFVTHPDDAILLAREFYGDWGATLSNGIDDYLRRGRPDAQPEPEPPEEEDGPMPDEIATYNMALGTWNWLDAPGQPAGTPVGLLAYAFDPTDGLDFASMVDHANFLAGNGLVPFLRIDYRPGITAPPDVGDLGDFLAAVDGLFDIDATFRDNVRAGRIIMSAFNEPNNPGEGGFDARWVARCFNGYESDAPEDSFTGKVRAERNGGEFCVIAAPAPNANGSADTAGNLLWGSRTMPSNVEPSPWASWYFDFLMSISEAAGTRGWPSRFDIIALHSYGRISAVPDDGTPLSMEPFVDIRSGQGWRFGSNGMVTWREVIDAVPDADLLPIWYTEFTIINEDRSIDAYPAGWMSRWRDAALQVHGDMLEAALWFVGDGHGVWENTALDNPAGRGPVMRADYLGLKALEDVTR